MMAVGKVLVDSGVWCVVWIVLFGCVEECVDDIDSRANTRLFILFGLIIEPDAS